MARRTLRAALTGAVIGAFVCAAAFFFSALVDGTGLAEAFGYSLVVAVIGAFLGSIVGAAVGLGNLKTFGGALAGLLMALAVVAFYVVGFGRSGEYGYFLSESRVIIDGLTAPLILTGMGTAVLKNKLDSQH